MQLFEIWQLSFVYVGTFCAVKFCKECFARDSLTIVASKQYWWCGLDWPFYSVTSLHIALMHIGILMIAKTKHSFISFPFLISRGVQSGIRSSEEVWIKICGISFKMNVRWYVPLRQIEQESPVCIENNYCWSHKQDRKLTKNIPKSWFVNCLHFCFLLPAQGCSWATGRW